VGQGWGGKVGGVMGDGVSDLTNAQCKTIHNCHYKSPPYNEHMPIKMKERVKKKKEVLTLFLITSATLFDKMSYR
jgi:hypothetical protein